MNWYLVKLVYKISTEGKNGIAEFDEQFRLFQASSQEEALEKAKITGVKFEYSARNPEGIEVSWTFINIAFIREFRQLIDGTELFSTTVSSEHPDEYVQFIHYQAEGMRKRLLPHAVNID